VSEVAAVPDVFMHSTSFTLICGLKTSGLVGVEGVPCFEGSCSEVYLEKAFDGTGWRPKERLSVAKALGETSLMFLVHPTLTQADINKTADTIQRVLTQAHHDL
jgi:dTDP-4-amino-4,6-dideoxygalactose transaminase